MSSKVGLKYLEQRNYCHSPHMIPIPLDYFLDNWLT